LDAISRHRSHHCSGVNPFASTGTRQPFGFGHPAFSGDRFQAERSRGQAHRYRGVEVSLEGLGASAQDIEALRRIRALVTGKTVAAQQEQEMRPSSSQVQPSQQQDMAPTHAAPDIVDFNIRQAECYLALLQSQIAGTSPP
jgi:hypothetical protein